MLPCCKNDLMFYVKCMIGFSMLGAIMNLVCIGLAFNANKYVKGGYAVFLTLLNFIFVGVLFRKCCSKPKSRESQAPYIDILGYFGLVVM